MTEALDEGSHYHVAWKKVGGAAREATEQRQADAKQVRDAAEAQRQLASDLTEVVNRFDPARAAAEEYRATLAKIAALKGAGKLNAGEADDFGYAAFKDMQSKAAENQARNFKSMFGEIEDPFAAGQADRASLWEAEFSDRQRRQEEGIRSVAGLYRNLMSGGTRSIFDSFKEEGINAIAKLAAKWTMSQIGKLSGSGGLIGSIASLISGKPKVGANAAGTEYWGGGISLVGENGPEIVSMARGARVTPAAETRRMLAGNDNGRRGNTIIIHANDSVLAETVRGWVAEGIDIGAARGAAGGSEMAGRNLSLAQNRALA